MDKTTLRYFIVGFWVIIGGLIIWDVTSRMIAARNERLKAQQEIQAKIEAQRRALEAQPKPIPEAKVEIVDYRVLRGDVYFQVRYSIVNRGRSDAYGVNWIIRPFSRGVIPGDERLIDNPSIYDSIAKREYLPRLRAGQRLNMKADFEYLPDVDPGFQHGDYELQYSMKENTTAEF